MKTFRFAETAIVTFICLAAPFVAHPCFGQTDDMLPKAPVSVQTSVPEDQQISPMPLAERIARGVVPTRGVVSIAPGTGANDLLKSGDGKMNIDIYGNPTAEQVVFRQEQIELPWPTDLEGPKIASVFPDVKKLILAGKYREGLALSLSAAAKAGLPGGTMNHELIPAFTMGIGIPADGAIRNYLRTVNFETGAVKVLWEDNRGAWVRSTFVSRADNVVVQYLTPPTDKLLNLTIDVSGGRGAANGGPPAGAAPARGGRGAGASVERDLNAQRLIVMGRFTEPNTGNKGYGAVVRVVLDGGTASIDNGVLAIKDAKSLMLLTRVEWYKDFQRAKVDQLVAAVNNIAPDYPSLVARATKAQSEIFDRASLDFDTTAQERAMSSEELLADQKTRIGFNLNLLSKMFDMGRYWLMLESGDYPPIYGHLNVNINLQVAGGNVADLPESMDAFYRWIEGLLPDSRTNAKNIFGTRGVLFATHPDHETGALYHFDFGWPHHYWISSGGWSYSPFWDRYLVTGDKEFLRNHVMPGLRELGLFYEDFLTEKDEHGNFIFVPSYSPENWPADSNGGADPKSFSSDRMYPPAVVNATMDIMVCREVLTHLIEGAQILGTDADKIPTWQAMLTKMPPYLLDTDGALKEWAWPTLGERQDHRHISHMYGVWPGDEIDPDRTPELAKAAWLADSKRGQGNASGHGISHRMLSAARLKDSYIVNFELKQLFEQGYVGSVLTTSHNPYTTFMPDQQGSILAVLEEMLLYSREGVIEVLPALPETLDKGSVKGILARSFAKVEDLSWDMKAKTVDLTISSLRDQDITLIDRYGIESIDAPAGVLTEQPKPDSTNCVLHLQQDKPVTLHLKIGSHRPSDWVLSEPDAAKTGAGV